jgi:cytochrome P450
MSETAQFLPLPTPDPDWHGLNPASSDVKARPHELYRPLREEHPVHLTPDGYWRLLRYDHIQQLLKHARVGMRSLDGIIPNHTREESDASKFMLRMDPPDHDRLRGLVSKAFTPRALAAIRPRVEAAVDAELEQIADLDEFDLVEHLAIPTPAASMAAMLGMPFEDRHRLSSLVSWATYLLAAKAFPELVPRASEALNELAIYMSALIEERRSKPGDDILTALVLAEEQGDRLDNEELLQQSIGLLIAGLETTQGLIGNGMRVFADHPGQFDMLAADPSLGPGAVEECLRYEPSVPLTVRVVWEDTRFGDYVIPQDTPVQAVLIAANRDPAVFDEPDRFDITRNDARHCSFGGGIHYCLGSHLARMNAEVAFTRMARRFRDIETDPAGFEWAPSLFRIPGKITARAKPR